jgi:glutathione S-transferase
MLDLDAVILPCPRGGPRFRREVETRGGKAQFPYLVDPNTGDEMYESRDIVEYLYRNYGDRPAPWWLASDVSVPLGSLATAARLGHGTRYRPARAPDQRLELASFEASPYSRIARETLCELELPYLLRNLAGRSAGRRAFRERTGKMMVPWLHDPNTGASMFESSDIKAYLNRTYATP